ncbi:MAG: Trimethylamine corrinoid protein [Methanomassiliicoccales archaeon PtaU1.Bin124]|nr:MAG: Trimethylamine corrinoid protein [Methanomassiliicoccales archaeon PtaU1.Bin124]
MATLDQLIEIVVKGKVKEAKAMTEQLMAGGITARVIIFEGLNKAMEIVGQKYEKKEYFLPQVLLSAQTLYQSLDVALPKLDKTGMAAQGKVVIAVVEGDVHDIGKNIVKAMLTGSGLTIIDDGRDVPVKKIVDDAISQGANIIATSTLMTPTLAGMKEVERLLKESNKKGAIKTMVGGGAVSKDFAAQIGADGFGYDANEAVKVAAALLK